MQTTTLMKAIQAAKDFIAAAEDTQPAMNWDKSLIYPYREHGKATAKAKRASMDLTRVLAELRANK